MLLCTMFAAEEKARAFEAIYRTSISHFVSVWLGVWPGKERAKA